METITSHSEFQPQRLNIKQRRSQKTYDALIKTGFKLAKTRTFDSITIAELARKAGYSVGAFYARFRSKDEYFDALLQFHMIIRLKENNHLLATLEPDQLARSLISNMVSYYWEHRHFWRTALARSANDPNFWDPIRQHGKITSQSLVDYVNKFRKKPISEAEKNNLLYAHQTVRSVINNVILNQPGDVLMSEQQFIDNLTRSFLLISDYQKLIPARKK